MKSIVSIYLDTEILEWLKNETDNISNFLATVLREEMKFTSKDRRKRLVLAAFHKDLEEKKRVLSEIGYVLTTNLKEKGEKTAKKAKVLKT